MLILKAAGYGVATKFAIHLKNTQEIPSDHRN